MTRSARHRPKETAVRSIWATLVAAALASSAAAQEPAIDPDLARSYFAAAELLSAADSGRLWGIELYGPLLFVDRATRQVVANMPDTTGQLTEQDSVWVGTLPPEHNVANTAFDWAGQRWTMVVWPPSRSRYIRQRLLMHELFHRIQDELGLAGANPQNAHLATRDGRILTRLEWRALEEALVRTGAERAAAVEDALVFRAARYARFENAAAEEQALELAEGLAEYTGLVLSGLPRWVLADRAAVLLASRESQDRLSRAFAYGSGPALGVLLDESGLEWRGWIMQGSDFATLLAEGYGVVPPSGENWEERAAAYDGVRLIAEETRRAERIAAELEGYRERFLRGPVVRLAPGASFRYSFNPNRAAPLDDVGTVYETARVTDEWGVLSVESGGVLMMREEGLITGVVVPAPPDATEPPLAGDGWSLELAEGWRVMAGEEAGDWVVVRE
jgi:hypothetical protein